jgi:release factor glutamine methyltransferase
MDAPERRESGLFLNIKTALLQGAELLARAGVAEPRLNAEVLLAFAMGCERVYFFAHPEQELREVEWIHYGRYLDERIKGKPTQYITHRQEFWGREFRVSPDVLIPRPETELLVETVLRLLPAGGRVIDVGTGSGAIAVSLGALGCDLSLKALAVARGNGAERLFCCDLLSCFGDGVFDAVVSNPPYVADGDKATLQREVRDWEPGLALFAGTDGLAVYRRLIPEAWRVLRPGGLMGLEFGIGQDTVLREMVGAWREVQVLEDLAGIPRVLVCWKQ